MNGLNIVSFDTNTKQTEVIDEARLKQLWNEPNLFFWADITDPNIGALQQFIETLSIYSKWTDHFNNPEILPHIHDTPAAISFYLYDIENAESLGDTSRDLQEFRHLPLLVLIGKRFTITYHQQPLDLVNYVHEGYDENFKLAGKTAGFIVFLLFQHCLYNYARLNLTGDNFLDALEFGLIKGDHAENINKIAAAGYNILTLKKLNANLQIILLMLTSKQTHEISDEARVSFMQLMRESVNIRETIDSSRYLLDSIIASIQADAAYRTGEIMRMLTIISFVFLPLTFLTGLFGMNFHLPAENGLYSFWFVLSGMGMIALSVLFTLRWLKWL